MSEYNILDRYMKKGRIIFLIGFIIFLLVALFLSYKNEDKGNISNQTEETDVNYVGNDIDEHGCRESAGYLWCVPKNKCLRIWEESCYIDTEEEIKYILAGKYRKEINTVKVSINKSTQDYISGSVSFGNGEGGIFLARRQGNMWEVVYDGNGSIDCIKMRQIYGFPDEILKPNFCD
ncbi:MAG TPA: hypothetical protein PKK07_03120 [bacterium]|jgi:alpha-amylase/alpha-mannosidase (GH57 family)|nr:hypothetical protein [bacterium]